MTVESTSGFGAVVTAPTERQIAARKLHGKWAQAGVPHKGWRCEFVEDLGDLDQICEMCESQEIRYVHHMRHADYPGTLRCGCICAGYMEGDYRAAKERERDLINFLKRRANWVNRSWRRSANGNEWVRSPVGVRAIIYPFGGGWRYLVADANDRNKQWAEWTYDTRADAKAAAFELFEDLSATEKVRLRREELAMYDRWVP